MKVASIKPLFVECQDDVDFGDDTVWIDSYRTNRGRSSSIKEGLSYSYYEAKPEKGEPYYRLVIHFCPDVMKKVGLVSFDKADVGIASNKIFVRFSPEGGRYTLSPDLSRGKASDYIGKATRCRIQIVFTEKSTKRFQNHWRPNLPVNSACPVEYTVQLDRNTKTICMIIPTNAT